MVSLNRLRNIIFRLLHRRAIAAVQLLVMVSLAVPACCYEVEPDHETNSIGLTAGANDVNHEKCPCCPDEKSTDTDNCSTCSYCSIYIPLTPAVFIKHALSVTLLVPAEQFLKLSDVHIPIFVPPQNLS